MANKNITNFFSNNTKINSNIEKNKLDYINKAIKCFKKVIFISKLNIIDNHSDFINSLYEFYYTFNKDDDISDTQKENNKSGDNFSEEKEIPEELLINSYFNLLMCLSMKKYWLEMILISKDYDNRDIASNKLIKLKIWLYQLEAYINLKNNKKVNEILSKIKKFKKIELSVLNKANNDIINDINIKLYIYYTLTKIYVEENNYKEAILNNTCCQKSEIAFHIYQRLFICLTSSANSTESKLHCRMKTRKFAMTIWSKGSLVGVISCRA